MWKTLVLSDRFTHKKINKHVFDCTGFLLDIKWFEQPRAFLNHQAGKLNSTEPQNAFSFQTCSSRQAITLKIISFFYLSFPDYVPPVITLTHTVVSFTLKISFSFPHNTGVCMHMDNVTWMSEGIMKLEAKAWETSFSALNIYVICNVYNIHSFQNVTTRQGNLHGDIMQHFMTL